MTVIMVINEGEITSSKLSRGFVSTHSLLPDQGRHKGSAELAFFVASEGQADDVTGIGAAKHVIAG